MTVIRFLASHSAITSSDYNQVVRDLRLMKIRSEFVWVSTAVEDRTLW